MKRLRDAWPVIVIVATIAGAAWMAAWNVQRFIAAEISASEARLAAQITAHIAEVRDQTAEIRSQIAEIRSQIAEIRQYVVDIVDHLATHAESD